MLGFTYQKVLPLVTLASVSRSSVQLSMAVDSLTVIEDGGESYSFGISAVEAGFPERFFDLFQLVLRMCKVGFVRLFAARHGVVRREKIRRRLCSRRTHSAEGSAVGSSRVAGFGVLVAFWWVLAGCQACTDG